MSASTLITIEINNDLNQILNETATEENTTKVDFITQALIEKLEDLEDIKAADEAYKKWIDGGKKTYSHEEMMEMYG